MYKKFEIEKYTVCGKLIFKKWKDIFLNFFLHNWHADMHGFANICKLPVSDTLKICSKKLDRKWFYLSTLNFVIVCIAKKLIFNVLLGVQSFNFFKLCKNAKNP